MVSECFAEVMALISTIDKEKASTMQVEDAIECMRGGSVWTGSAAPSECSSSRNHSPRGQAAALPQRSLRYTRKAQLRQSLQDMAIISADALEASTPQAPLPPQDRIGGVAP